MAFDELLDLRGEFGVRFVVVIREENGIHGHRPSAVFCARR
jgi:hypothetical protein